MGIFKSLGFFLALVILTSSFNFANAYIPINDTNREFLEPRISVLSLYDTNDTYFINYSLDGNEYRANETEKFGAEVVKGIGLYTIEIDGYVSQKITILDNYTLRLLVEENPENPYPKSRIPVRLCMNNNSVKNANRFETDIPYCDSEKEYYVGNIRIGSEYAVRLNENIHDTSSLIWWLGEDDLDGTYGQGGGLPSCDFVFADISRNQTQTYVNDTFIMGMKWDSVGVGCSVSYLEEQNLNDVPAWKLIGTGVPTNTNLQCLSSSCSKYSPAYNTWYYRTVKCTEEGNRSLRVYISSRNNKYNSPTRNMECLPLPTIETSDDEDLWFIFFFFAMGAGLGVYAYNGRTKRRDK